MKLLLDYNDTKALTITLDGETFGTFVAMGFKQREVHLPDGSSAIELRYMVNSPERFEHVIRCKPVSADEDHVMVERIPPDAQLDESIFIYTFEPLTMAAWKDMVIGDREELEKKIHNDEELRQYYRNDWLPAYWTEDFNPFE